MMFHFMIFILFTTLSSISGLELPEREKPKITDWAGTARWLVNANHYGSIATNSVHNAGFPFVQPKSFVDGGYPTNSTGIMYFYDSGMDTSLLDIAEDNSVSFALTAATLGHCPPTTHTDPENPTCARAVFTGNFVKVTDLEELVSAKESLYARHPMMKAWPKGHDFQVYKIDTIKEIWLIDIYGGAKSVDLDEYYNYQF